MLKGILDQEYATVFQSIHHTIELGLSASIYVISYFATQKDVCHKSLFHGTGINQVGHSFGSTKF
jgi:hypothetical protein